MEAIATGLGLSSSAGLNAYLPLLLFNLAVRFELIDAEGATAEKLASWQALAIFSILLIVEMIVDKVPVLDTLNDIVGTVIRPVAGAALMSASTGSLQNDIDPTTLQWIALITGGISAGSVHGVKAVSRPLITGTTGGTGNWAVSIFEDIISFGVSIFAILLPFIMIFVAVSIVILALWWLWETQRRDMVTHYYKGKNQ
ncbi:MAG: DUF4126 domain-containing protein [Anaerolineales bacterium]|nr:DUF4126 domain-containing protein [Anaerolineales bacterium]